MIKMMAKAVPKLSKELLALVPRLIDIWPVVKNNIYHPDFHGSFSLKDVYPVLCNTKKGGDYSKLSISEGSAASVAFVESLKPETTAKKKEQIQKDLIKYCAMDTKATYLVHKALVASCK
jgi:predicted RecB family nuclease